MADTTQDPEPGDSAIIPSVPTASAKPTTERAIIMAAALKEDMEQRAILMAYVGTHMKKGVDYGVIPGTKNPTLLKPGAEKLTDLFRCTPTFELIERVEDWDRGLFHYMFRVKIVSRDAGTVLAEGFGSANSKEGRYRWRNAARKCPECGKETIIKGKEEYGGGWLCFVKKGGCGAKWSIDAPEIVDQVQGTVENDDIFTLVNTILKMAKKRALVDGAIALARCSDIFTQDVEDFMDFAEGTSEEGAPHQDQPRENPKGASKAAVPPTTKTPPPSIAVWHRAIREFGGKEKAKEAFRAAAEKVFGTTPKPTPDWTVEDCAAVEKILFDIPF